MKRASVLISALVMVLAVALVPASASGPKPAMVLAGSFVTTVGNPITSLTGVGATGDWRGWQLTMSYRVDGCGPTDTCGVLALVWHLTPAVAGSGAPTSLSGTCLVVKEAPGECAYGEYDLLTGDFNVPLVITSGSGNFAGARGVGKARAEFVDTYTATDGTVTPVTGDMTIGLDIRCPKGVNAASLVYSCNQ